MALEVTTKDSTALSDGELEEMADLCVDRAPGFDIGFLSKERDSWVLVTHAREGKKLRGYSFCTLERIGGTPSLLVGLAVIERNSRSDTALRAIMADQYRRALLAFPDEDVLLGTRLLSADGFRAFGGLADVVPRPGHRASGEERAWGRRLAKRFGADSRLDYRSFVVKGETATEGGLDFATAKGPLDPDLDALFAGVNPEGGDRLVSFGWAMAEDLASGRLPR